MLFRSGAKEEGRIKKAFRYGMSFECMYWVIVCVVVYFGAPTIMKLFVKEEAVEVMSLGTSYLTTMSVIYILPALTNGIQGYFRGMGDLKITLMSTFLQIVGRVSFAFMLAPKMGMVGIAYSCCMGWIVMLAYEVPMYIRHKKALRQLR